MDAVVVATQEKAVEVAAFLQLKQVTEQEYVDEASDRVGRGGRNGVRFGCGGYRT